MEQSQQKVSVIIPVYNSADYLEECLDSILGQTYTDIELICVDDGSTDASPSLLNDYAARDNRVVVLQQENQGPGVARNRGIEAATGEYLYFMDADDFCDHTLLECAVNRMEATNADMVILSLFEHHEQVGAPLYADWVPMRHKYPTNVFSWKDNPDWIFQSGQNWPWNKFVRASFVQKHHLRFQEIYLTEDLMFSAPALLLAERLSYLQEPFVYHREGTRTNTMSTKDRHPFDFLDAFLEFEKYLKSNDLYNKVETSYINWAANACIYNLVTLRTYEAFEAVFKRLSESGLQQLGLLDVPDSMYQQEYFVSFLKDVQTLSPFDYLYKLYDAATFERGQRSFEARLFHHQRGLLTEENNVYREDIARLESENGQLRAELEEMRRAHEELCRVHEEQMNAAEQKVGQLICYVPRAIQRVILKKK